ncbi:Protein disulfide-isomerase [Fasciola gigantica]|uniref:Protein disulfide-isomerase n=1 Tax=Fasciola gigantica TaxID=46835 RepID=A0A504YCT7_FASGI|nr:Protein disulfide-isomerase [Fasciola gigantica]
MDFIGFMRNFQSTAARYNNDPTYLLNYLISACEGEPAEAIRWCTVLEPQEGYDKAIRLPERRFGRPHVIARKCIDELSDGSVLKQTNTKALIKLADQMKVCSATMKSLGYQADLNACRTLSAIVQRLPTNVQSRWFDRASFILKSGREPTFCELTDFVSDQGDAAVTGLVYITHQDNRVYTRSESLRLATSQGSRDRVATVMSAETDVAAACLKASLNPTCPICKGPHYVDQCSTFQSLSVADRNEEIKKMKPCFLCLKPNHVVKNCRSRRTGGLSDCKCQHHPKLHRQRTPESNSRSIQATEHAVSAGRVLESVSDTIQEVSFAIVPVRLRGPLEVTVNGFLDNGSDSTFIDALLMKKLDLKGKRGHLTVKTVTGSCVTEGITVSLAIPSLDRQEVIQVHRA